MGDERAAGARLSILYFSGTGGTRLVAELLGELLSPGADCEVTNIEDGRAASRAAAAELLVLCYPTFYLNPPPSMREFADRLGPFDRPKKAYVITTCELYSENSIRSLCLGLRKRGIAVAGSKVVSAPGSDVTCVIPDWLVPRLYRFEKGLTGKLLAIAAEIEAIAGAELARESIPAPRWYTPFTQLLQILFLNRFDAWRYRMRALPERCARCGECARLCGRGAWAMKEGLPVLDPERCELCTRCLHRCPSKAIVLIKGLKDNRRLDAPLYARLREEARESLGLARGGTAR
jgi:ferredoxin/flavodoxin